MGTLRDIASSATTSGELGSIRLSLHALANDATISVDVAIGADIARACAESASALLRKKTVG